MIPPTPKDTGIKTLKNIELKLMMLIQTTAKFMSLTTFSVLNNANSLGNAEELDLAKEEDGALDMMDAPLLHFLSKVLESSLTIDLSRNFDFI